MFSVIKEAVTEHAVSAVEVSGCAENESERLKNEKHCYPLCNANHSELHSIKSAKYDSWKLFKWSSLDKWIFFPPQTPVCPEACVETKQQPERKQKKVSHEFGLDFNTLLNRFCMITRDRRPLTGPFSCLSKSPCLQRKKTILGRKVEK